MNRRVIPKLGTLVVLACLGLSTQGCLNYFRWNADRYGPTTIIDQEEANVLRSLCEKRTQSAAAATPAPVTNPPEPATTTSSTPSPGYPTPEESCNVLGVFYATGDHGLVLNEDLAREYFRKACEGGSRQGCKNLRLLKGASEERLPAL